MQDKYEIDRAYGKVYEYSQQHRAHLFLCTFFQLGATPRNRDKTIIKLIERWKDEQLLSLSSNGE